MRIEDVLDPYIGVSEGNLHAAFEAARANAPCVLFLDELDAVAYARRKQQGGGARALVDQLLQELDAIGSDNSQVLVLAATNAPWDVDDALKRPGRFDRLVFVPPPDAAGARADPRAAPRRPAHRRRSTSPRYAARTPLFSGADLRHLAERAVDSAIDETLASGGDVPSRDAHLDAALAALAPTTLDWLATARNYVEFANESGRYDDVLALPRLGRGQGRVGLTPRLAPLPGLRRGARAVPRGVPGGSATARRSGGRSSSCASFDGHQIFGPMSNTSAGTRTMRTRNVSSSTPKAMTNPISRQERDRQDAEHGERPGEHDARRRDDAAGDRQAAQHPVVRAVLQRLLADARHQEDVVVDPQRDEEDEREERDRRVAAREAEDDVEDDRADAERGEERQRRRSG